MDCRSRLPSTSEVLAEAAQNDRRAALGQCARRANLDRRRRGPGHKLTTRFTRSWSLSQGPPDGIAAGLDKSDKERNSAHKMLNSTHQPPHDTEQIPTWRAIAILRSTLQHLPSPLRLLFWRIAKAGWWILTPHRT